MSASDTSTSNTSASSASNDGPAAGPDMTAVTREAMDAMERITRMLLETAGYAYGAAADPQAASPERAAELSDPDPFRIAPEAVNVWSHFSANPAQLMQAQVKLWHGFIDIWSSAARRASGETAPDGVAPPPGDRRWRDEEWRVNPMFDAMKQTYLLMSGWMLDIVANAPGVDDATRKKVTFFTKQIADAFAPTNFPMTNPTVLRRAVETQGESLLTGLRNLARDMERGHGHLAISQTDRAPFVVGENVAVTEGDVVFENKLLQLIQYRPRTETVHARPLVIFPPWINKYYILDLRAENSLVRWLTEQGHQVFLASWVNPTRELADLSFDDHMRDGIFPAVDAACEQTSQDSVNTVGYCIGGTLLAATLALMGKRGDKRINSATFFTAQTDFSEAGDLLMFINDEWLGEIERRMDANGGVLDGQTMADTFNMLRANDLVWSFFIQNYLMGEQPKAFDLLFWNSDSTRLTKTNHLYYLRKFYMENALAKGTLTMDGAPVALPDIAVDTYVQAGRDDHIAPFRSVYKGAKLFGGNARFMLAGSGHIAGVVNHPAAKKYQHWINEVSPLPDDVEDWLKDAREAPGSWWHDWDQWLVERSGERIPTPKVEDRPLPIIEPAPGRYVKAE